MRHKKIFCLKIKNKEAAAFIRLKAKDGAKKRALFTTPYFSR